MIHDVVRSTPEGKARTLLLAELTNVFRRFQEDDLPNVDAAVAKYGLSETEIEALFPPGEEDHETGMGSPGIESDDGALAQSGARPDMLALDAHALEAPFDTKRASSRKTTPKDTSSKSPRSSKSPAIPKVRLDRQGKVREAAIAKSRRITQREDDARDERERARTDLLTYEAAQREKARLARERQKLVSGASARSGEGDVDALPEVDGAQSPELEGSLGPGPGNPPDIINTKDGPSPLPSASGGASPARLSTVTSPVPRPPSGAQVSPCPSNPFGSAQSDELEKLGIRWQPTEDDLAFERFFQMVKDGDNGWMDEFLHNSDDGDEMSGMGDLGDTTNRLMSSQTTSGSPKEGSARRRSSQLEQILAAKHNIHLRAGRRVEEKVRMINMPLSTKFIDALFSVVKPSLFVEATTTRCEHCHLFPTDDKPPLSEAEASGGVLYSGVLFGKEGQLLRVPANIFKMLDDDMWRTVAYEVRSKHQLPLHKMTEEQLQARHAEMKARLHKRLETILNTSTWKNTMSVVDEAVTKARLIHRSQTLKVEKRLSSLLLELKAAKIDQEANEKKLFNTEGVDSELMLQLFNLEKMVGEMEHKIVMTKRNAKEEENNFQLMTEHKETYLKRFRETNLHLHEITHTKELLHNQVKLKDAVKVAEITSRIQNTLNINIVKEAHPMTAEELDLVQPLMSAAASLNLNHSDRGGLMSPVAGGATSPPFGGSEDESGHPQLIISEAPGGSGRPSVASSGSPSARPSVAGSLAASPRASVAGSIAGSPRPSVAGTASPRASVAGSVFAASPRASVAGSIAASPRASVAGSVAASPRASVSIINPPQTLTLNPTLMNVSMLSGHGGITAGGSLSGSGSRLIGGSISGSPVATMLSSMKGSGGGRNRLRSPPTPPPKPMRKKRKPDLEAARRERRHRESVASYLSVASAATDQTSEEQEKEKESLLQDLQDALPDEEEAPDLRPLFGLDLCPDCEMLPGFSPYCPMTGKLHDDVAFHNWIEEHQWESEGTKVVLPKDKVAAELEVSDFLLSNAEIDAMDAEDNETSEQDGNEGSPLTKKGAKKKKQSRRPSKKKPSFDAATNHSRNSVNAEAGHQFQVNILPPGEQSGHEESDSSEEDGSPTSTTTGGKKRRHGGKKKSHAPSATPKDEGLEMPFAGGPKSRAEASELYALQKEVNVFTGALRSLMNLVGDGAASNMGSLNMVDKELKDVLPYYGQIHKTRFLLMTAGHNERQDHLPGIPGARLSSEDKEIQSLNSQIAVLRDALKFCHIPVAELLEMASNYVLTTEELNSKVKHEAALLAKDKALLNQLCPPAPTEEEVAQAEQENAAEKVKKLLTGLSQQTGGQMGVGYMPEITTPQRGDSSRAERREKLKRERRASERRASVHHEHIAETATPEQLPAPLDLDGTTPPNPPLPGVPPPRLSPEGPPIPPPKLSAQASFLVETSSPRENPLGHISSSDDEEMRPTDDELAGSVQHRSFIRGGTLAELSPRGDTASRDGRYSPSHSPSLSSVPTKALHSPSVTRRSEGGPLIPIPPPSKRFNA